MENGNNIILCDFFKTKLYHPLLPCRNSRNSIIAKEPGGKNNKTKTMHTLSWVKPLYGLAKNGYRHYMSISQSAFVAPHI